MHFRTLLIAMLAFIAAVASADNRRQDVIAGTEATELRVVTFFQTSFHVAFADGSAKRFRTREYPPSASAAVAGPSPNDVWVFFADGIVRYSTDTGSVLASFDFPEPERAERRLSAELVINRDGTRLALWILDRDSLHCRVRIFNAATLQLLEAPGDAILGTANGRLAMTFSPDGAYADLHNFHRPDLFRWSTTSNAAPASYALPNPGGNFLYLNGQPALAAKQSEVAVHHVRQYECSSFFPPQYCLDVDYTTTETLLVAPLVGAPIVLGTSTRNVMGERFSADDGSAPTTGIRNYPLPYTLDGLAGATYPSDNDPQNFDHTLWAVRAVDGTTVYRMVDGTAVHVFGLPVPLDPDPGHGWKLE